MKKYSLVLLLSLLLASCSTESQSYGDDGLGDVEGESEGELVPYGDDGLGE